MTIAEQVAYFALSVRTADVPVAHLDTLERSAFDLLGVLLAGRTSPHGAMVETQVRQESIDRPGPGATVLGAGFRTSGPLAALANANAAHADDFDDMGGYGHPTAPVLPAALAAAELAGPTPGAEVLTALLVGFELGAALCSRGHYDQYTRCFHSTPVFGTLAAAVASARVLRLPPDQTAHALALACSTAAGLGRNSGTMVKPLHAGQAAANGLAAALQARAGLRGRLDVFEARGGFWETFFGTPVGALGRIVEALGAPFTAADTLFLKRFPCCGSNQSALNGLEELLRREELTDADIAEVVVHRMSETSPVLRYPDPAYGLNAKFSIQYVLGTYLAEGRLGLDEFTDQRVRDGRTAAALAKVRPEVLSRWDKANLAKSGGNPVSVRTVDGRRFEAFVKRNEMRGGPKAPFSEDELMDKFTRNARRSLPAADLTGTIAVWRHLGRQDDVRQSIAVVPSC